jgi:hypothetical protein
VWVHWRDSPARAAAGQSSARLVSPFRCLLLLTWLQEIYSVLAPLRPGVSFPILMKLLGHTPPDMSVRCLDVALTDLEPRIPTGSFTTSASCSPAEDAIRPPSSWHRWNHRLSTRCSTGARDLPPCSRKWPFAELPRPALQPPHQNRQQGAQTPYTMRMGRNWAVMPTIGSERWVDTTAFDHELAGAAYVDGSLNAVTGLRSALSSALVRSTIEAGSPNRFSEAAATPPDASRNRS